MNSLTNKPQGRSPETGLAPHEFAAVVAAAEPSRLAILFLLGRKGPMCVKEIATGFTASRPAISHHLRVLKQGGLLEAKREGQEIHYGVRVDALTRALRGLAEALEGCCERSPRTRTAKGARRQSRARA